MRSHIAASTVPCPTQLGVGRYLHIRAQFNYPSICVYGTHHHSMRHHDGCHRWTRENLPEHASLINMDGSGGGRAAYRDIEFRVCVTHGSDMKSRVLYAHRSEWFMLFLRQPQRSLHASALCCSLFLSLLLYFCRGGIQSTYVCVCWRLHA